jgi:serine/threonine protein kinase
MAEVFLARLPGPEDFETTVVVKRIRPELAHMPRMEDMFVAEATLAAQVQHKNVVQVFELQRLDTGELFMAMEYVDGTDLAHLLRGAILRKLRIPPWFSAKVVAEVLDGLGHAHDLKDKNGRSRNLVHRDVTPSNIFVSKQGAVKLADFGVAKDETRTSQTLRGELKGKLAYMPPEQLRREPIDRRADIFSTGVVLWELLAQRRLFGGSRRPEMEVMNLICSAPRIAPSAHHKDVHPDLDRAVLRAIQVDPDARYQDAGGFQKQLLDVLDVINPGIRMADMRDVFEMLLGIKPAPSSFHLEVEADVLEETVTDSSESETRKGVLPAGLIPVRTESSRRPSRSNSFHGEFPFWARTNREAMGPQNYWDMLHWLKRTVQPNNEAEISTDGSSFVPLALFARLTGQQGLFGGHKPPEGRGLRVQSGLVAALAGLHRSRSTGILAVNSPSGSACVHFFEGNISSVISSHPQLQTPEILIDESVLRSPDLPATVHQVLKTREPIEDVAASDGWQDAGELRRRTTKLRLSTLLGEEALAAEFHPGEAPEDAVPGIEPFSLLADVIHETLSVRSLRTMLARRMKGELTVSERFPQEIEAMKLDPEDTDALKRLISSESIETWLERYPEDEAAHLHLAYLLFEIGLLEPKT